VAEGRMMTQIYTPHPSLAVYVALCWFHEGTDAHPTFERVLPDAATNIIIKLGDDPFRLYDESLAPSLSVLHSIVTGPRTESAVIDTASQKLTIGVHFKPGGAYPFFDIPAHAVQDAAVPLDALWGREASVLRERLLEAPTLASRFQQLEQFLLARLQPTQSHHPAVDYALRAWQRAPLEQPVAELAAQGGYSTRHFIQLFREQVGMTPKRYCRVQRFQAALDQMRQGKPIEWADLALACGYYDQAHFINDFKAFSGFTPTAYATHRTDHPKHVTLP
jgi:AraC-like DNA-binding protein